MCLFSFKFGGGLRSKTFGMNWPVIQFMSVNICAALSDVSVAEWEQIPAGRSQKKSCERFREKSGGCYSSSLMSIHTS